MPIENNATPLLPEVSPPPSNLSLPPFWADRIASVTSTSQQTVVPRYIVPRDPAAYSSKLTFVDSSHAAEAMLDLAQQRALAFVGIDTEYRYRSPPVLMKTFRGKAQYWQDPRSVVPLLMAVVLVEQQASGQVNHYPFVIDLRMADVLAPLAELLRLPVPFLTHFARAELFCCWQLGLPAPTTVWDTWVAEKAFLLGRRHPRYKTPIGDDVEEARVKEEIEEANEAACALATTCLRYGVPHPFSDMKAQLQQSFLEHDEHQPFTQTQLDYCLSDAAVVAEVYHHQLIRASSENALTHLMDVEMPWAITNARMVWDGVRIRPGGLEALRESCDRNGPRLSAELQVLGLNNVGSHSQVKQLMGRLGLLEYFRQGKGYSFDDKHLEAVQDRHEVIGKIRELRKIQRLSSDKLLTGKLVGVDGRLHPEHQQLGAHSTRNTMRWPNIGGIGQALRPLVVPAEGMRLGEVDLSQIEVGIAAAVYGDARLIEMFNQGDVYSGMARLYYRSQLSAEQMGLQDHHFKRVCRTFRNQMKIFTLAIIYNITPMGLAAQLGITIAAAARERENFLNLFPTLDQGLRAASDYGAIRGFASLCNGLRRYRGRCGRPSNWEVNWMRNTPVQGSAAVVFKTAGNRLYRRYQHYGARLILPLHDAFLFEVPKQHLSIVSKITAEVMRGAVQECFPELNPNVEINIDHPDCWNKDGKARSLSLWMVNPGACQKYLKS